MQKRKDKHMNISAKIKKVMDTSTSLKAIADIVIDESVIIHSVKLYEKDGKRNIAMPNTSWVNAQGETITRDTVHPLSQNVRQMLTDAAFGAYDTYKSTNE